MITTMLSARVSLYIDENQQLNCSNVLVQVWDREPEIGSQIGTDQTIQSIVFGETRTIQVEWNTASLSGTHAIYVTVDPYNDIEESDETNNIAFKTITIKPFPIQTIFDLAGRNKSGKVQLTWTPVPGAECYNVYRGTQSSEPCTLIAGCHVTDYCTYLDEDVVNSTTYYYVVRSITEGIESLDSNEASATPQERVR